MCYKLLMFKSWQNRYFSFQLLCTRCPGANKRSAR